MSTSLVKQEQNTPATLLQTAIEKNLDIDKLKELMELQDKWEKKQAKKSFYAALASFQERVPVLRKDKTAKIFPREGKPAYSYKYASLGSITSQIKDALKECGLSYRWEFTEEGSKMKVACIITHVDGHSEVSTLSAGKDNSGGKNEIQQSGSTQTYLQRYSLIGALGLSTAEDDNDGKGTKPQPEDDDYLNHWVQSVNSCRTRQELLSLFNKNRNVIESDEKIKSIFKKRESELPKPSKTDLP